MPDELSKTDEAAFEAGLLEYKEMVILRQTECQEIGEVLQSTALKLSRRESQFNSALIVLGAVVALKGFADLLMLTTETSAVTKNLINAFFALCGIVIAFLAISKTGSRLEGRAGELRALATQCRNHDSQFMSDYKLHIDKTQPVLTLGRLSDLIDMQNKLLERIRIQSSAYNVDLSGIKVSYSLKN